MDPLDIAASTGDALFGTNENGRIVMWNEAAERLLGHSASDTLGQQCADVIRGRDVFGNLFCTDCCSMRQMVQKKMAPRRFEMDLQKPSGEFVRAAVSTVRLHGPTPSQFVVLHVIHPSDQSNGANDLIRRIQSSSESAEPHPGPPLTSREIDVLRLLAEGSGTNGIADHLGISVTTVRTHIQNALGKLGAHSRLEAVALAFRRRLI